MNKNRLIAYLTISSMMCYMVAKLLGWNACFILGFLLGIIYNIKKALNEHK